MRYWFVILAFIGIGIPEMVSALSQSAMSMLISRYIRDQQIVTGDEFKIMVSENAGLAGLSKKTAINRVAGRLGIPQWMAEACHAEGKIRRCVSVPFKLETFRLVARLRDGKLRQELLTASDVEFQSIPSSNIKCQPISPNAEFEGMQFKRNMEPGELVCWDHLERPELIKRNDIVTMRLEHDGLLLTGRGRALENGRKFEMIRIENIDSKRPVYGKVIGSQEVKVIF